MYKWKLVFIIELSALFFTSSIGCSQSFGEANKRFIYEIQNPGIGIGTGFVVRDSLLGRAIVTAKHVVQDKNGNYVDSILVRRNKLLPTGQVVSDTSAFVVRLKIEQRIYLAEHPNRDIDLVMIPFLDFNTTLAGDEPIYALWSHVVLSKKIFLKLGIDEGTDIELIGFSLSSSLSKDRTHYHFSRFGKVGLFTTDEFTLVIDNENRMANFVLLDMTVRPGDSGSPIIATIAEKRYLIGFVSARSELKEYGIGYPAYYIHDLIKVLKDKWALIKSRLIEEK